MTKLRYALALSLALVAVPALGQNTATTSGTRVQGTPDGKGDPVQVTFTTATGADIPTGNGTAAGSQRVTVASDNSLIAVTPAGNVASGAADSGNPVKVGCPYTATQPSYTDGQRGNCQIDGRGNLLVTLNALNGGTATPISNTNGLSVSTTGLSSTYWRYTSGTSPILSNTTTAVTIKTAAGAGVKNFLDSCEISSTALGASVPFAIRDGAGGTVMFALRPPAAGWLTPVILRFNPPLVGTANTLLEVVTTTADTSGTFDVNCQGHTGS